jgi:hypothetical protein
LAKELTIQELVDAIEDMGETIRPELDASFIEIGEMLNDEN